MTDKAEAVTETSDTKPDITDRFEVESNVALDSAEPEAPEKDEPKKVEPVKDKTTEAKTPEQEPKKEPPKAVNPRTLARRAEKERLIRENAVMAEKLKQFESKDKEPQDEAKSDPSKEPRIDDYEDVFDYNKAVMKHELYLHNEEQKLQASQQAEQKLVEAYDERARAFAMETPDFDEKVVGLVNSNMVTPEIGKAILSSDMGAELSYHLANYGADLMTLRGLPKEMLPKAIKSIESFIKEGSPNQEKPRVTQASPPITPPGVSTKTDRSVNSYTQEEIENMPLSEYNKKFNVN